MANLTKKDICRACPAIGYISALGGIEVHEIVHCGVDDYVICVSNAWYGKPHYHKLRVYYTDKGAYIRLRGYRLYLSDFSRIV